MFYTPATQRSPSFTQKWVCDIGVDFEEDDWTVDSLLSLELVPGTNQNGGVVSIKPTAEQNCP